MRFLVFAVAFSLTFECIAAEPVLVPLSEVVTTSKQEGMRHVKTQFAIEGVDAVENAKTIKRLAVLLNASGGASNVFLVEAENATDAIQASSNVVVSSHPAQTPASSNGDKAGSGSFWLVASLGVGSGSPDRWVIDSATKAGNTIRFTYREPKAGIRTSDMLSYYYWAPLGKLDPGAYKVELYDADEKAVTLMRRVVVKPSK